jgi:hypothetical protein
MGVIKILTERDGSPNAEERKAESSRPAAPFRFWALVYTGVFFWALAIRHSLYR